MNFNLDVKYTINAKFKRGQHIKRSGLVGITMPEVEIKEAIIEMYGQVLTEFISQEFDGNEFRLLDLSHLAFRIEDMTVE